MSILWGVLVFHEQVRGGWFIALAVVSGLVMASAVVALARSPLLSGQAAQSEEERPGHGRNEHGHLESRSRLRSGIPIPGGGSDSKDRGGKRPVRDAPGGGEC